MGGQRQRRRRHATSTQSAGSRETGALDDEAFEGQRPQRDRVPDLLGTRRQPRQGAGAAAGRCAFFDIGDADSDDKEAWWAPQEEPAAGGWWPLLWAFLAWLAALLAALCRRAAAAVVSEDARAVASPMGSRTGIPRVQKANAEE